MPIQHLETLRGERDGEGLKLVEPVARAPWAADADLSIVGRHATRTISVCLVNSIRGYLGIRRDSRSRTLKERYSNQRLSRGGVEAKVQRPGSLRDVRPKHVFRSDEAIYVVSIQEM
jgi:hypothetical protein